jgi:hypothetical protein
MAKYKNYDVSKYKVDPDLMSMAQRIAHMLDWCSKVYPGTFFHPTVILQGIMGYKHTPRINTKEAESVRNTMGHAQKHLMDKYKRGFVSMPGMGYRATVDSEDIMSTTVEKKRARFNSARIHLGQAVDLVNPREIPNTENGKRLKANYYNLKDATKTLFSAEFEKKILAPPLEATEKK